MSKTVDDGEGVIEESVDDDVEGESADDEEGLDDGNSENEATGSWLDDSVVRSILQEHLDETDYQIYRALNEDGRMSDTELGERVGLSRTAARRRRKILQDEGIIDIIGVLILQEADLAYADVRVCISPDATTAEIDAFVDGLLEEEQIYEIDEYMGSYDLLIRVWHGSLQDVKRYVGEQLQDRALIESYETLPVIKTRKAWHKVINGPQRT